MEALASIIIPTFNRRRWIGECLDSVLAQTYKNLEILVVDDGSSDGTAEWIASRPEYSKVQVLVQENAGASVARNNGINRANGDLIAFIDSDDVLLPKHIESAVKAFEKDEDLGLFCCDSRMIDAEGNVLFDGMTWHQALAKAKNLDIKSGERSLEDVFSYSNCFPGFTLRKAVFDELGGFDQSIFPADDYDLALRVAGGKYKVFYLHEPLCLRREHDGQCSGIQNSTKTQIKLMEALRVATERSAIPGSLARKRLGEVRLELGISRVKGGMTASGLVTMVSSLIRSPRHISMLFHIVAGKLRMPVNAEGHKN
jgi:glycosyltransferase involved in cell wall biosynthesis